MADVSRIELYRQMVLIRCFEEEVARLFRDGQLPGFVHLSVGQEAVAVGVCSALERDDWITTTHRGHGHVIAKGADLRRLAAELHGSEDGACRGLGGSMHLVDISRGVLSASAIVGASIPLATGAAFAFAQRRAPHVAACFFGEGATSQGILHESLNIAALWNLPVIYVCENNGYAEMTPVTVHTPIVDLSAHGRLYGIHACSVDGNDVEEVRAAMLAAVERARTGGGPAFIECRTYRIRGHFEGDPQKYKPQGENDAWRARDPILILGDRLSQQGATSQDQLTATREEASQLVEQAFSGLSGGTSLSREDLERLTYTEEPAM